MIVQNSTNIYQIIIVYNKLTCGPWRKNPSFSKMLLFTEYIKINMFNVVKLF